MELKYREIGDSVIIEVGYTLDTSNAQEFKEWVREKFIKKGFKTVILDFSRVKYIDSYALGVFVALQKSLAEKDGQLVIVSPNDSIRKILEVTYLDKVIKVVDSLKEVLEVE